MLMAVISAYGFNEGSGTTARDLSGNGHTLTAVGSPWNASGHTDGAAGGAYFTSANGLGPNSSLNNYSFMCWIYVTSWTGNTAESYSSICSDGTFFVEVSAATAPAGKVDLFFGGTGTVLFQTSTLSTGAWNHVCATFTTTGPTMSLYVNGVSAATPVTSGAAWNFGTGSWVIGATGAGLENAWTGLRLDDVRLFDTTLTVAEVVTWMNTPVNYPYGVLSPTPRYR